MRTSSSATVHGPWILPRRVSGGLALDVAVRQPCGYRSIDETRSGKSLCVVLCVRSSSRGRGVVARFGGRRGRDVAVAPVMPLPGYSPRDTLVDKFERDHG